MAIVADHVQHRVTEDVDDSQNDGFAHRKHKFIDPSLATQIHSSNWKAWEIGTVGAVALVAVSSIALFNNARRPGERYVESMGVIKPQGAPVTQLLTPPANQFAVQALRAPTAREIAGIQNGALATNRSAPAANSEAPMIAHSGSLTILVRDFAAARASLNLILARCGGYSANLTVDTPENGQRHFQASLRIPANHLDLAVADLKMLGRTLNESQSGEEVTQQHADLAARLQNARETEQRLRTILQQRTGKIDDVLQVEEEIARVRGQIESMEAEQRMLEHRVDFADVNLQFFEEYKEQFNPSPISTSSRLRNSFVEGMRNASGTLLGLALFLEEFGPAILIWSLILGLPAYFVWRRYRRARVTV